MWSEFIFIFPMQLIFISGATATGEREREKRLLLLLSSLTWYTLDWNRTFGVLCSAIYHFYGISMIWHRTSFHHTGRGGRKKEANSQPANWKKVKHGNTIASGYMRTGREKDTHLHTWIVRNVCRNFYHRTQHIRYFDFFGRSVSHRFVNYSPVIQVLYSVALNRANSAPNWPPNSLSTHSDSTMYCWCWRC